MATSVVYGIYASRSDAEDGVTLLKAHGTERTDVSLLFARMPLHSGDDINGNALNGLSLKDPALTREKREELVKWLTDIRAVANLSSLPLIAAGPLVRALSPENLRGADSGLAGALTWLGIPEYEALRYEKKIAEGGVLLCVCCSEEAAENRARTILRMTGAEKMSAEPFEEQCVERQVA